MKLRSAMTILRAIGLAAFVLGLAAAPAQGQTTSATLTGVTCPGAGCLAITISTTGQVAVQIGNTYNGTLVFEKTVTGTTWVAWTLERNGKAATYTQETGIWTGETEGSAEYRIRFSQYYSGSADVEVNFLQQGGGNFSAKYLIGQADDSLPNAQNIGELTAGIMKLAIAAGATPTGTLETAVSGTDYLAPTGSGAGLSGVALLASSYADPSWITSLAWTKITSTPTTISGYGITDAQPLDSDLTAIAAITTQAYGRSLLALADAPTARTSLGVAIGTNVEAWDADLDAIAAVATQAYGRSLLALTDAPTARTSLGVAIGTNVEAWDADLDAIAAVATQAYGRSLLTLTDAPAARTSLGLAIGTNVQAWDADLDSLAAIATQSFGRGLLAESSASSLRSTLSLVPGTDVAGLSIANTFSANSAASTPAARWSGTWFTGGTGTTTTPHILLQPSGATAATTWNTAGTVVGINASSGFAGDFYSLYLNGARRFGLDYRGLLDWNGDVTGFRLGPNNYNAGGNAIAVTSRTNFAVEQGGWFGTGSQFLGYHANTGDRLYGLFNSGNSYTTGISMVIGDSLASSPNYSPLGFQAVDRGVAGGNCNGAKTADFSLSSSSTGNWYAYTITGSSCAFTFSNGADRGHYTLILTIDGTGGYSQPSWPTMKWDGGSAPSLNMTANKINVIELWYDGTNYIGKLQVNGGL